LAPKQQLEDILNDWLERDFLPRSANGLRCAATAVRYARKRALDNDLPHHENLYLKVLMASADGSEGIQAFLERRAPVWQEVVTHES
jgi:enoyl-CoA hydratase/carnithine racemase